MAWSVLCCRFQGTLFSLIPIELAVGIGITLGLRNGAGYDGFPWAICAGANPTPQSPQSGCDLGNEPRALPSSLHPPNLPTPLLKQTHRPNPKTMTAA